MTRTRPTLTDYSEVEIKVSTECYQQEFIAHAWHDQHTHNWSRFSGVRLWVDITLQTL